jgi:hypothetical protein
LVTPDGMTSETAESEHYCSLAETRYSISCTEF